MSKTTKTIAALGMVAALGVAALPLGAFAVPMEPTERGGNHDPVEVDMSDDHANATVDVTINSAIAIALTDYDLQTTINPGAKDETSMVTTATVSTNDEDGYTLTATSLGKSTGVDTRAAAGVLTKDSTHTIANATSGTYNPAAGTAGYGIKGGDVTASFVGLESPVTLKANGSAEIRDEATAITFAVNTPANQATGTYSDEVQFTAAVKD